MTFKVIKRQDWMSRYNADERNEIAKEYVWSGDSLRSIGKRYGVSYETVRSYVREYNQKCVGR